MLTNQADRFINLSAANNEGLAFGHQTQSHKRLYLLKADRVRRGRISTLVSAFSPALAAKKVDQHEAIDTSSAEITEIHRGTNPAFRFLDTNVSIGANQVHFQPSNHGRNLVNLPSVPLSVNTMSNEYIAGFNDRLSYTGRQTAKTRAKNSKNPAMFMLGYNVAQRKLNASKPARKPRKKTAKVA